MEKNKMNPRKIVLAATTLASAALLSIAGAQAGHDHAHAGKHVAMHHHRHMAAAAADTAGAVVAGAGLIAASLTSPWAGPGWEGNYWAPSAWGDYECRSQTFGCRPYGAWTQH